MNSSEERPTAPAYQLTGLKLDDGWRVTSLVEPSPVSTGGCFSVGYEVEKGNGTKGFLKALDYSRALQSPDPPSALKPLVDAYEYERNVLNTCREKRMNKIATAISHGTVDVPSGGILSRVSYLIFERADRDARAHLATVTRYDTAWRLRALHNVATALKQLHGENIAHQDLKPSNVLLFGRTSKVADLGRASQFGVAAPHDDHIFAGDPQYTPIEACYGHFEADWRRRRLGTDLYLLGSLIHFFFTQAAMTPAIVVSLDLSHHPRNWGDRWESVIPYVRQAFNRVCDEFCTVTEPLMGRDAKELTSLIQYLCDPDPALRGHPLNRRVGFNQHSTERFISRLDVFAQRAEMGMLRP